MGAQTDDRRWRRQTLTVFWRSFLILLASAVGAAVAAGAAAADLRIVAPSAPGSGWDQLAQAIKAGLETGEAPRVVEIVNIPGGGGAAGLTQFLVGPVDGDVLVTGLTMVDAILVKHSPVALERLTPIARLASETYAVVVPAKSPYASMTEFVAALQTEPARIPWAGGPTGGLDHAATALLAMATSTPPQAISYVPFLTTGDAVAAAIEGRVGAAFLSAVEVEAAVKAGQLKVLGVASPRRLPGWPEVPTLHESGLDLDFANWRGLVGRPEMPRADRLRIQAMVSDLAASPRWKALLTNRNWQDSYLEPDLFTAFMKAEKARIKAALLAVGVLKGAGE
jgi:putative tricarboxylic transport membrane protein